MNQKLQDAVLADESAVREVIGTPVDLAVKKAIPKLDQFSRELIERSPFLTIGTANANGKSDVSPRGDGPGFVLILDDNTIFIPERPGNNRVDTLSNITEN
ncbi:MAG: pyridoxamine 5'-phosphate oxidase family protein, partial [Gammaproteobacteria bacterium]